ncbi:Transposase IS116/IS110/IS902 family protein (plasmid) [Variovorax sp. SRS16]|uniref:IS110 family transposase n=1 Tax=Variovorax sp. SRS16 TaxID=282217 RepID=UPI001316B60E|nr:IS110 family transposase [Variovorax sp. SRS16]VTU45336.1 Transposase IS116/IS110/IS902 family protein [Variovorax sp. SRS16]VTU45473.1 Transposase IS116/IS110/IS902 family protein [Variovorax sp. SRS16]
MNRTTYGLDIAKNVMQLHWVDGETGEIGRRKLPRSRLSEFFAQRQPARVAMEACGSAHHWARVLGGLGHQVELLPARQVRAFVRSNKDDAADARAIWLAAQQSDIRRAPVKTIEQQAVMSLHRARSHWVSVRTATINMLRSLLYEFGVVLPGGKKAGLKTMGVKRAEIDDQLSPLMRRLADLQLETLKEVERSIDRLEVEIAEQQRRIDQARTLREVPGIGVLGATALAATLGDASGWRSGREFAASLGLVPAHSGTGGKTRVGHLSKRGDPYLRTLLIHGARSVITHAKAKPAWLEELLRRRPLNVAVVALANKMARTAWALLAHGRAYRSEWKSTPPSGCGAQAQAA